MTKQKKPETGKTPAQDREDRLKAALKANLAKRKAQSRARASDQAGKGKPKE